MDLCAERTPDETLLLRRIPLLFWGEMTAETMINLLGDACAAGTASRTSEQRRSSESA